MVTAQTPSASGEILTVQDLKTYYHKNGSFVRAVDGVSFTVRHHATVGLAGESGSGKTQTALSVMGLTEGSPGVISGQAWVDEVNVLEGLHRYCRCTTQKGQLHVVKDTAKFKKLQERRLRDIRGDKVAMVFQEPKSSLSPYFSVGEQLRETLAARYGREVGKNYQEQMIPLLERMQFAAPQQILQKYPHQLSGGESQRVMLALALIGHPKLLIADEPTTLLDVAIEYRILELLASLLEEKKIALLLITHNLAILKHYVDDVVVMFAGKVIEQGPTANVINGSAAVRHPYTEVLMSAAASLGLKESTQTEALSPQRELTSKGTRGCCYYSRCRLKDKLDPAKRARCGNEEPPLFKVGETHYISCWEMEGQVD